jgi:uncharacterized membrane protein
MTPRTRVLTLLGALGALGFSVAAAWVHHRIIVDPSYVSPCDINTTFSCSKVYLSRYGTVGGVPVALGGVIWSVLVLLIAGAHRPEPANRDDATGSYLFALATVGLAVVLYFAYASSFILKTFCVLCIGTYVSVIGVFIVTGLAATTPMLEIPVRLLRDVRKNWKRPAWLLVVLLFLGGSAALVADFPREAPVPNKAIASVAPQSQEARFLDSWAQQPRIDLGIPADGAKVVVVKFNDWQCPSCKAAHIAYGPVLERYAKEKPGAVKYVLKDFPLNSKCNFQIGPGFTGHPATCEAAVAVRLARAKGKDKEDTLIDYLYANQETLTPSLVKDALERIAGVTDFDAQYPIVINDVKRDVTDGGILHVSSTPTFYINGVHANTPEGAWLPANFFDLAIQYELARADKPGGK